MICGLGRHHNMETHTWMLRRQSVDDSGYDPNDRGRTSTNTDLSYCRIGDGFYGVDALSELIEDDQASINERTAVGRRLNTLRRAIEQRYSKRCLHVGDGSRY